jgi:hypothetical protein
MTKRSVAWIKLAAVKPAHKPETFNDLDKKYAAGIPTPHQPAQRRSVLLLFGTVVPQPTPITYDMRGACSYVVLHYLLTKSSTYLPRAQ